MLVKLDPFPQGRLANKKYLKRNHHRVLFRHGTFCHHQPPKRWPLPWNAWKFCCAWRSVSSYTNYKSSFFFSAGHGWDTTHQIGLYKEQTKTDSPQDPSDERYIYLHEWLICMVNVGKYTSPMDPMGTMFLRHDFVSLVNVVLSWIIWRWRSLRLQQRAGV